ncbi:MAG: DUF4007 family protein [Armatimonadota bacterium]
MNPKLQLSKGFDLDLNQTSRLLQWLVRTKPARMSHKQCADELGLPESRLEHIASHSVAMGLILPRTGQLTPLGKVLIQADQYLSGHIAPWILHYNISAEPRYIVWHRMVNDYIHPGQCFSADEARRSFHDLHMHFSRNSAINHLSKELRVFLDTYTDGAFSRLMYIEHYDDQFHVAATLRVPSVVFGYALLTFAQLYRQGETAISVHDITTAASSPGRIYIMSEANVRAQLEQMHRLNIVTIENKGDLDQVRFVNTPDPADYLCSHFEEAEV